MADNVEDELYGVVFTVGGEEFVLDIVNIEQIVSVLPITPVPKTEAFVLGIFNLRGKVVPVISAHKRLVLRADGEPRRIIVINSNDKLVGLLVDNVIELARIQKSQIAPPPPFIGGIDPEYVESIARKKDRLLIILNTKFMVDAHSGVPEPVPN